MPPNEGNFAGDDRGVSEVIGVALLVGMVFLSAWLVVVFGAASIEQVNEQTDERTVEIVLQEIDSKLSSLSNQADVTRTEFEMAELDPGGVSIAREGYVNITVNRNGDCSVGGAYSDSDGVPLSSIRYVTQDETTIAYEAGGVFRRSRGGGSSIVSAPDAQIENGVIQIETLNLTGSVDESRNAALLNVTASQQQTDTLNDRLFSGDCVRPDNVTLKIKSDFYRAWGNYLEEQTDRDVRVNDGNSTVLVYFDQDSLPPSTDDARNRVVNFSKPDYMGPVSYKDGDISIDKGTSNQYRVSTRPISNGTLDIANKTTFKTANLAQRDPTDLMFVLDVSGSMDFEVDSDETEEEYDNRLEAAQAAATDSLSVLNASDRAGVVWYSAEAGIEESDGRILTTNLFGSDGVEENINSLDDKGATCINCGLRKALNAFSAASNQTRNQTIILLSDGNNEDVDYASDETTEELAERAAERGITVYTAGFGASESDVGDVLEEVADITGGDYKYTDSPEELSEFFEQSATNVVEEERVVKTPLTVNATREGTVEAPFIAGTDDDIAQIDIGGENFPNVNDPTAPSQFRHSFLVSGGDTVELNATWTSCDTDDLATIPYTRGETQVARCTDADGGELHVPSHVGVYKNEYDASSLLTGDKAPWGTTIREKLESEGLLDGDDLDLESNQLLVVFNFTDIVDESKYTPTNSTSEIENWNRLPVLYEVGLSEGEARPPVGYVQVREVRIADED